jgi:hypothetical protein
VVCWRWGGCSNLLGVGPRKLFSNHKHENVMGFLFSSLLLATNGLVRPTIPLPELGIVSMSRLYLVKATGNSESDFGKVLLSSSGCLRTTACCRFGTIYIPSRDLAFSFGAQHVHVYSSRRLRKGGTRSSIHSNFKR